MIQAKLICKCGASINKLDYNNHTNEEGQEWSSYVAYCHNCGMEWKCSAWGECENAQEAQRILQDYINES